MLSLAPRLARYLPFYYGWVIAVVAGLVSFAGTAESPAILGIFFTKMEAELGWSRTTMSGSVLAGTFLIVLVAPVAGRLTDAYGPRVVVTVGAAVTASAIFCMGYVTTIPLFYALVAIAYSVNTGIARVAVNAVIAKWFVRSRGRAMAVLSMFLGLGFAVTPVIAAFVTDASGWRMGWHALGIATFLVAVPVSLVLLRGHPSEVGQRIDGEVPSDAPTHGAMRSALTEVQWAAREALRTPTFWLVLISMSTLAVAILGFAVHLVPHLESRGIDSRWAALAFTVAGLTMLPSSPLWGVLLDRFSSRAAFIAAALVVIAFTVFTLLAWSAWMVIPIGVSMGIGFGGFGMVQRTIYANYFGRQSAGTVLGLAIPFIAVAQGMGTFLAGAAFDLFGSYEEVFSIFAGFVIASIGVIYLVRLPERKPVAAAGSA